MREKDTARRLEQYSVELKASNQALDAFSRGVAHDLKSPLGGILGLAELVQAESCEKTPDLKKMNSYGEQLASSAEQLGMKPEVNGLEP